MKAVVLTAGRGERLAPLTDRLVKPLMPVVNRPVMEHILGQLHALGVREVYANLYYRPDDLQAYFGDGRRFGVHLTWRREERLTGPAGGALLFADCLGDESALVISGDALHDIDLAALADLHHRRRALLTVAMKRVPNPGRYGVGVLAADSRITAFEEKPALPAEATGLVSCGIYCVDPQLLGRIPLGVEYDFGRHLIPTLAAEGAAVYGYETSAYWTDIGSPEALRQANLDVLAGRVRIAAPGVEIRPGILVESGAVIPEDAELRPPVLIGTETRIDPAARVHGPVVVGPRCEIGAAAYVSRSLLLAGARLAAGATLIEGVLG